MKLGWKDEALCRAEPGGHWDGELLPSMFAMCMRCPVKDECLMEALDHEERSDAGVWGGTDVEQRRQIRKGADPYLIWEHTAKTMRVAA